MPRPRSILHVDLDAFYVAVERLRDRTLVGRPVVVGADPKGGSGRGVVAACSYEAREFGIRSAMPIGEAYRRCPEAVYIRGHRDLYARAARAVRAVFERITPRFEPVSIDEAYLDLTGTERLHGPARAAAERLRREIVDRTRLPVSMGLGTTRTIAKVASECAKPEGFLEIPPGAEASFIAGLPVDRLPGVGPATVTRLRSCNIETVGDLAGLDDPIAVGLLGDRGISLRNRARGIDPAPVVTGAEARSISRECTFDVDTRSPDRCLAVLASLCERASHDLRAHGLTARTITLKLRYEDFTTVTRSSTLSTPTDADRVVSDEARDLFRAAYRKRGGAVRLVGVSLSNLGQSVPQLELFASHRSRAWDRLVEPLDALRDRYGFSVVRSGKTLRRDRERD